MAGPLEALKFASKLSKVGRVAEKLSDPLRTQVIPMPNRWFLEPAKFPNVQPLVEKVLAVNKMERSDFFSGAFVDPKTGKVLDFNVMQDVGVAIDPRTNRPKMSGLESGIQSFNEIPKDVGPATHSNLVRQGLFKRTGGDPVLDDLNFLATIERSGAGHQYGMSTEYATPTEMLNTMTGDNPTLRPHSRGDLFGVGDVVGQISTPQGMPKDVYESLLVAPKGSDVEGVRLHKAEGGAVDMKDGTDAAILKILAQAKAKTAPSAGYNPYGQSSVTQIGQFERDFRDRLVKEQMDRLHAVKRGIGSWIPEIPGFLADLAVDLPYNLAQRAAGRRGDNIKPLGFGEDVRRGVSQALGMAPASLGEAGMSMPPDETNEAVTTGLQLANPLMWGAAGNPVAVAKAAGKGAKALGPTAAKMAEDYLLKTGQMLPVIKPPSGNWVLGNVENSMKGLRSRGPTEFDREWLIRHADQEPIASERGLKAIPQNEAINQFIDKQLTRYVKNQMGTAEDPVRAIADRGMLHYEPPASSVTAAKNRRNLGLPMDPVSTTPYGQAWENAADAVIEGAPYRMSLPMVTPETAPDALRALGGEFAVKNPEAMAYSILGDKYNDVIMGRSLGFNHLIDELRNATNPASGLPRELMLKPESLSRLSVPQAVERVAKINEWRADQIKNARLENMLKADVHKEYPEKGMRWVQLNKPGQFAEESDAMGHSVRGYEPTENGGSSGYGLGGWDAIQSGEAKVYSLRDAKGEPHATIEVKPGYQRNITVFDTVGMSPEKQDQIIALQKAKQPLPKIDVPASIKQIKGKSNKAPNEQYLPYVQDFVRSGKWSDVGDLRNTGLHRKGDFIDEFTSDQLDSAGIGEYLNMKELKGLREGKPWKPIDTDPELDIDPNILPPMKRGGPVSQDAMQMAVWNKKVQHKQLGGVTKGVKAVVNVVEEALRLKAAAKAAGVLPKGQQAVLSAAESKANLEKFLSTSHDRRRLYHATPANFSEFQGEGFDPTISGNATWLTANKERQPAAHNTSSRKEVYREGVNVMPVHVQAERPLVMDDKIMEDWAKAAFADDSPEFPFLIAPEWLKKIKAEGYDSIFHPRSGEVIMLEPNKIKSAIGNRGTYDTAESDISKAKGGLVNQDAMQMAVWDKAEKKARGGILGAAELAVKLAKQGARASDISGELSAARSAAGIADLPPALKIGVMPGLQKATAALSNADKAEARMVTLKDFKALGRDDKARAIASARAAANKTGVARTTQGLSEAFPEESDMVSSFMTSAPYKIRNVVPDEVVDAASAARKSFRSEPATTPGANASEKEWAEWGESHGVNMTLTKPQSLGISDLTSGREVMIPGGLSGKFTIPDMFWMKSNNINPASLPQDVHTQLMKKFIRTHENKNPDAVDIFNQLDFALLSPSAPLVPNEFLTQRLRIKDMDELRALAGRVRESGLDQSLVNESGVGAALGGGLGIRGTANLKNQAVLADLILRKPEMFQAGPGETLRDVTIRVMNQVPGLGTKTASLGTPWLDLSKANTSAVDLHMIRDATPRLLQDPVVGDAFRSRMAKLLGTEPTAEAILAMDPRMVQEAAIKIVGAPQSKNYRLASGALNDIPAMATPDKLLNEPKSFTDFGPFYNRVVDYVDESRGLNPEIELFPEQWRKWDVIRQRIEPHEFAHPDWRKLPKQSFNEMQESLKEHSRAGYKQSINPVMKTSDWRKMYYGKVDPELLIPLAGGSAAASAYLADEAQKQKKGGKVQKKAAGGLTSDDLVLEERKL